MEWPEDEEDDHASSFDTAPNVDIRRIALSLIDYPVESWDERIDRALTAFLPQLLNYAQTIEFFFFQAVRYLLPLKTIAFLLRSDQRLAERLKGIPAPKAWNTFIKKNEDEKLLKEYLILQPQIAMLVPDWTGDRKLIQKLQNKIASLESELEMCSNRSVNGNSPIVIDSPQSLPSPSSASSSRVGGAKIPDSNLPNLAETMDPKTETFRRKHSSYFGGANADSSDLRSRLRNLVLRENALELRIQALDERTVEVNDITAALDEERVMIEQRRADLDIETKSINGAKKGLEKEKIGWESTLNSRSEVLSKMMKSICSPLPLISSISSPSPLHIPSHGDSSGDSSSGESEVTSDEESDRHHAASQFLSLSTSSPSPSPPSTTTSTTSTPSQRVGGGGSSGGDSTPLFISGLPRRSSKSTASPKGVEKPAPLPSKSMVSDVALRLSKITFLIPTAESPSSQDGAPPGFTATSPLPSTSSSSSVASTPTTPHTPSIVNTSNWEAIGVNFDLLSSIHELAVIPYCTFVYSKATQQYFLAVSSEMERNSSSHSPPSPRIILDSAISDEYLSGFAGRAGRGGTPTFLHCKILEIVPERGLFIVVNAKILGSSG